MPNRILRDTLLAIAALTVATSAASAHEYYLIPDDFSPPVGEPVAVRHKLGQRFKGNEMPWIGLWNIRSELWRDGSGTEIAGKDGDRPALTLTPESETLQIVIHQSNIDRLDFREWEKFENYAKKSGLDGILQAHLAAGKPKPTKDEPITELYQRFAKTLIAPAGSTEGRDVSTGLTIELVAQAHPLALAEGEPMPVQLLWKGKPLSGATVTVFSAIDSEPSALLVTGADGKADIPDSGRGPYLLNAIHMEGVSATGKIAEGADYQSYWASLTYERKP